MTITDTRLVYVDGLAYTRREASEYHDSRFCHRLRGPELWQRWTARK